MKLKKHYYKYSLCSKNGNKRVYCIKLSFVEGSEYSISKLEPFVFYFLRDSPLSGVFSFYCLIQLQAQDNKNLQIKKPIYFTL